MNKHIDQELDHEYDGIKEFDNPLPRWWLMLFYISMVFAVGYLGYYHFGPGPSLDEELAADLAQIEATQKASAGTAAQGLDEEVLLAVFNDPAQRQAGAAVYKDRCTSCHGEKGEGLIGPNLTDQFWIHGNGSLSEIARVVGDGVSDKGMPPWKGMLKENEYKSVVAFVRSLKGTQPANAKAPQGIEIKE